MFVEKNIGILIVSIIIVTGVIFIASKNNDKGINTIFQPHTEDSSGIPDNLFLPFKISDIDTVRGEVNPVGVVRFSRDESSIGHSGIDFPLREGAIVTAAYDGEIVNIKSAGDEWGGMGVYQLLAETGTGEGWAFIYEHIFPRDGLKTGDVIRRGELIGTKAAPNQFTAHFQLSRVFNNYDYIDNIHCWPDFLDGQERAKLDSWWDSYKTSDTLVNAWEDNVEEGKYPFRGLLDKNVYPDGPELCYPLGTDVR